MRFGRRSAVTAGVVLVATGVTGAFSVAPANAVAQPVIYSATVTLPVPPAKSFAGTTGGDGWALALSSTAVYNVFHHSTGSLQVDCHLQANASGCGGYPKTITDPADSSSFNTSGQPGLWLDQGDGHLFVYATRVADGSGGVVCIDTTQPASNANPFCGYTMLTAAGDADTSTWSAISNPVVVGTNWYAFNQFGGSAVTGTRNKMLCFSLSTLTACPAQPYAFNAVVAGDTINEFVPTPGIAAVSKEVIVPTMSFNGSVYAQQLTCFDTTTRSTCAGSWPVPLPFNYIGNNGDPFPLLSSTGVPIGVCLPTGTDQCFSLSGASVPTPPGMSAGIPLNTVWNGDALVLGPRVYVANGLDENVYCYDYSTDAECPNFPKATGVPFLLYTVNPDPQRPSCIWVNSDDYTGTGPLQIMNFDAYTGNACGQGAIRVLASQFIPPVAECVPSSFTSLQVEQPTRGSYANGTVAFEDGDGNAIAGLGTKALDSTGSVDLSTLHLVTSSGLPQFLITLNGAKGEVGQVVVKITWEGTESPACLTQSATVISATNGLTLEGADGGMFTFGPRSFVSAANFGGAPGPLTTPLGQVIPTPFVGLAATPDRTGYWYVLGDGQVFDIGSAKNLGDLTGKAPAAKIVGIAATADGGGYWLAGADGSIYPFGDASKTLGSLAGHHLNAPIVAIVATPDGGGYWLIGGDGGVFQFGDAKFHGSLGGIHLNAPVVAAAAAPNGGYVLAGSDGGLFQFDVTFHGSLAGHRLNAPIVAVAMTTDGGGYWMIGGDGGVFPFGDAPYQGSLPGRGIHLRAPIVGAVN